MWPALLCCSYFRHAHIPVPREVGEIEEEEGSADDEAAAAAAAASIAATAQHMMLVC